MKLSEIIAKWENGWRGIAVSSKKTEINFRRNWLEWNDVYPDAINVNEEWDIFNPYVTFTEAIKYSGKIRPNGTVVTWEFASPRYWLSMMSDSAALTDNIVEMEWELQSEEKQC